MHGHRALRDTLGLNQPHTLIDRVRTGTPQPRNVLSQTEPIMNVLEAYQSFDRRDRGWIKGALDLDARADNDSDDEAQVWQSSEHE